MQETVMPAKGYSTGNDKLLQVKITPRELDALKELASSRNTTVSQLMRDNIRRMLAAGQAQSQPAA
jgi:hypothetical protein